MALPPGRAAFYAGRMPRQFRQVDVFTETPYLGNPVAVVLGADGLSAEQMQLVARWTNLSETAFVLAPRASGADYQVRIFTPARELPFAGHPTLGTCHAWLETGGRPADPGSIVQECEAGLITVRRTGPRLAFAAPPLVRSGPVEEAVAERVARTLNIARADIADIAWADNGPGWVAVLLASAEAVLAVQRPVTVDLDIGVTGPYPAGSPEAIEVRAFSPKITSIEDPVTGSLNASLGQWLLGSGRVTAPYVASQGTAMGRRGRVHVSRDADGQVWVGGGTVTCVSGTVELLAATGWLSMARAISAYRCKPLLLPVPSTSDAATYVIGPWSRCGAAAGSGPRPVHHRPGRFLADINALHPFREGNRCAQRAFFSQLAQ